MITTEKERAQLKSPRGHQTIVCVDDEPLVNRALYRLLSKDPYDVLLAGTPEQALRYVRDHDVDLVVTDQRMPEMSGVELLAEVRQVSPTTAGLILTAYPESVLADEPPSTPGIPLVAKPWDDETLRIAVQELLKSSAGGGAARTSSPEEPVQEVQGTSPSGEVLLPEGVDKKAAGGTVLVPLDGSPEAEAVLAVIMPIVRARGMKIELVRVIGKMGLHPDVFGYMERSSRALSRSGIRVSSDVRWGDPADEIVRQARHSKVDLIALTMYQDLGLARILRGGVTERALRQADIPVLVCRPGMTLGNAKRILVPLDGSKGAEAVLPDAVRLAEETGATLFLVRSATPSTMVAAGFVSYIPPEDPRPYLEEMVHQMDLAGVPAEAIPLGGPPAREIVRYARSAGADLVCMTTRGRRGLARLLLGSITEEVVRSAPCPVWVRRSPTRKG